MLIENIFLFITKTYWNGRRGKHINLYFIESSFPCNDQFSAIIYQVCRHWKSVSDEDQLWKVACEMTWKGKQNMPLERWIRAAVIDKGMAEQAYFTDNFVSFLNDDETDEFDDDEAGSEYTLQVLEEEHDVLCNDMQRILYDAMLAERADTSNEAQHDDIAQHSVEDDTNSDAVEEQQTQLAGENLEAWEVLSFFMATLLLCTFLCAALVVIHAAPLTQPTAAAGLPPPPRPAPRPHARRRQYYIIV